jgi:hypothetical protein
MVGTLPTGPDMYGKTLADLTAEYRKSVVPPEYQLAVQNNPLRDNYKAYMDDFMRKSQENSMNPNAPQISPMSSDGFRRMFPNGVPSPMPPSINPSIFGGPANKMGPQSTQTGMPQFANPYAREFMGLGQAAANQMGLGQAAAAASQRPMQQAQPRPASNNYGGFQSIQGMGANLYGGFNAPPAGQPGYQQPMQQAQQQPQPQPQQNNMFGSFGGAQQQPAQNQGPNQQAQRDDQSNGGFGGGGGGGGGLF